MSDAVVNHLIHLPYLYTWHVQDPPLNHSTLSSSCLDINRIPLTPDEPDFETVANGMIDIPPASLGLRDGRRVWYELSEIIQGFRGVWTVLAHRW